MSNAEKTRDKRMLTFSPNIKVCLHSEPTKALVIKEKSTWTRPAKSSVQCLQCNQWASLIAWPRPYCVCNHMS